MNLKDIMPRDRTQFQKVVYSMIPNFAFAKIVNTGQAVTVENRSEVARDLG